MNDDFLGVLKEAARVAERYVVVSDPVLFEGQNLVSRYFYSLDRGGCFRTADGMKKILEQVQNLEKFCFVFAFVVRSVVNRSRGVG